MAFNTLGTAQHAANLGSLVRTAAQFELHVPKSVQDELDLHRKLTNDPLKTGAAVQKAQEALSTAPVGDVGRALNDLSDAVIQAGAAQVLGGVVQNIATNRLQHAVYSHLNSFESEAVEKFNAAVEDHELNRFGPDLPDLAVLVSPLDLGRQQNRALDAWRNAAPQLNALWNFYIRVVQLVGHEPGPGGADELSTNLSLACRLGNPGRFSTATNAANLFASIATGSDASRRYSVLSPFCVTALCGYDLHLSTSEGAAQVRRQIQPAAAVAAS
jgi:hypothetical protein